MRILKIDEHASCRDCKGRLNGRGPRRRRTKLGTISSIAAVRDLATKLEAGYLAASGGLEPLAEEIRRLNRLGLLPPTLLVGPVVLRRPESSCRPFEGDQLIQAALSSEFGAAAIAWTSEEYDELQGSIEFEAEAFHRAQPLTQCSPAIKALVWPKIGSLVERLMELSTTY